MRDRKELVAEIREAFAGADRPAPPFVRTDKPNDTWLRQLEAEFAAREELDAAFLYKHIFAASQLRPDAFRWLVRSLLFETLAIRWEMYESWEAPRSPEHGLIHASVYWLRPNPIAVLQKRTDYDDGIRTRNRLAPAERVAVCHFLRAMMESPAFVQRHIPHLAAQAIVWCWSDDRPALEVAGALRADARSYRRPPAEDATTEALVRQIEETFADTPMPAGPLLTFIDEQGADYELELTGTAWQTMQPWLLSLNGAAFCWMSPEAFRYFLPAALRAAVLGVRGNADPDYHLVNWMIDPRTSSKRSRERIAAFTASERAAIVAYLRACVRYAPDELERALAIWES